LQISTRLKSRVRRSSFIFTWALPDSHACQVCVTRPYSTARALAVQVASPDTGRRRIFTSCRAGCGAAGKYHYARTVCWNL